MILYTIATMPLFKLFGIPTYEMIAIWRHVYVYLVFVRSLDCILSHTSMKVKCNIEVITMT